MGNLKHFDKAIIILVTLSALLVLLVNKGVITMETAYGNPQYKDKLFNEDKVHTIDIIIDDWQTFLDNAKSEEYVTADLNIDDEIFYNVGLRTKGNNSLRLTEKYGKERFSLKIEMDHFYSNSYYGLDKFSLDSSFQDNSYLKTFLTMDMMRSMGVATPLVSYVEVSVNQNPWGLFLAIEEPEEAFAKRNYGRNFGQLYKPDYKKLSDDNDDVALIYNGDDYDAYDNIFRKSKFKLKRKDKDRLIQSLKILDSKENLESAVDIDSVLKYFSVQTFVVNLDSYLGKNGHNYFLYEEDGIITMLPWDYNLAYGTYSLGMPNPINDSSLYINAPIDTPASKEVMLRRPMFHNVMSYKDSYQKYHYFYDEFISNYFESGYYLKRIEEITEMIDPYVKNDQTRFIPYEDYRQATKTITKFIELRAQSVRKQLDGDIPSTINGQSKDDSNFIDASEVWLPDLGEVKDLK